MELGALLTYKQMGSVSPIITLSALLVSNCRMGLGNVETVVKGLLLKLGVSIYGVCTITYKVMLHVPYSL